MTVAIIVISYITAYCETGKSDVHKILDEVNEYLNEKPDSAFAVLNTLDISESICLILVDIDPISLIENLYSVFSSSSSCVFELNNFSKIDFNSNLFDLFSTFIIIKIFFNYNIMFI